jgi:hypothetical protein
VTIQPFSGRAAWDARTLKEDPSWVLELTDAHRNELSAALDAFKAWAQSAGLTAQWLHGHMQPPPAQFPLPTLGPLLCQARLDLEDGYGLVLLRGFPVEGRTPKDLHLLHAGLCGHLGTPRPQTVFGELVQDLRDTGQAALRERRGSKHNRALPFHNDPCDVVSFLCIRLALSGGTGLFASSVAIHDALLESAPQHVETLYQDFTHAYQDYLYVRTGTNQACLPKQPFYAMPTFSAEQGRFACKYSRFYIDQAQELPGVAPLSGPQRAALDALEAELANPRWQLEVHYQPGDVVLVNNFVCFHARTTFIDDEQDERRRRHLLRLWLSMPNSRPLAPQWQGQLFFQRVEAGAIRGGVPCLEPAYA